MRELNYISNVFMYWIKCNILICKRLLSRMTNVELTLILLFLMQPLRKRSIWFKKKKKKQSTHDFMVYFIIILPLLKINCWFMKCLNRFFFSVWDWNNYQLSLSCSGNIYLRFGSFLLAMEKQTDKAINLFPGIGCI